MMKLPVKNDLKLLSFEELDKLHSSMRIQYERSFSVVNNELTKRAKHQPKFILVAPHEGTTAPYYDVAIIGSKASNYGKRKLAKWLTANPDGYYRDGLNGYVMTDDSYASFQKELWPYIKEFDCPMDDIEDSGP